MKNNEPKSGDRHIPPGWPAKTSGGGDEATNARSLLKTPVVSAGDQLLHSTGEASDAYLAIVNPGKISSPTAPYPKDLKGVGNVVSDVKNAASGAVKPVPDVEKPASKEKEVVPEVKNAASEGNEVVPEVRKAVSDDVLKLMLQSSSLGAPAGFLYEATALWKACDLAEFYSKARDRVEFHRLFRVYMERRSRFLHSLSAWLRLKTVCIVSPDIDPVDQDGWVVFNCSSELLGATTPQVEVRKDGVKMTVDLYCVFCGIKF